MNARQSKINMSAKLLTSEAEFPHLLQNAANDSNSTTEVIHHAVTLIQMLLLVLITYILQGEYCQHKSVETHFTTTSNVINPLIYNSLTKWCAPLSIMFNTGSHFASKSFINLHIKIHILYFKWNILEGYRKKK